MEHVAKVSCWVGLAIWLVTVLTAPDLLAGPLVRRPRDMLFRRAAPTRTADIEEPTSLLYDTLVVINWFAWAYFALRTTMAVFGELDTAWATATIGYVYIMAGLPTYLAAWLWLVHVGSHRTVASEWMVGAPVGGAVLLAAYSTIG